MSPPTHYEVLPTKPPPKVGSGDQPYPARGEPLPRQLDAVTREWLTGMLQHRYPAVVVREMQFIDVRNGHTTKVRLKLDLNEAGREAGIPEYVCLKSNWSEGFDSGDICELEPSLTIKGCPSMLEPGDGGKRRELEGCGTAQSCLTELR